MARKLIVEVVGDTSKLEKSLRGATATTKRLDSSMGRMKVGFGTVAKATAGVVGLTGAFSLLGDAVHAGISEFSEAAKANADLNAVLKSTHRNANVTAKQIDALSTSLMNLSGVDDEVIKGGATMLLTFRNVRNEVGKGNDIFTQATKAALDMSVRFKTDVAGSAKQLGKALNDPIRGITALRRIGITFSDAQAKQIKQWTKHGEILRAQKAILHEVTLETGGAADALGNTLAGKINILRENAKNLSREFVAVLAPSFERLIDRATKWIQNADNQKRVIHDVREAARTFGDILKTLKGLLDDVNRVTGSTTETVKLFVAAWAGFKITALLSSLGLLATGVAGVGTEAEGATAQAVLLRGALARLAGFGAITIGIELVIHKNEIDDWLQSHGLGGLRGGALRHIGLPTFGDPAKAAAKPIPMDEFVKAAQDLAAKGDKAIDAVDAGTDFASGLRDHIAQMNAAADRATAEADKPELSRKIRNAIFDNAITRALLHVEGIRSIQGQIVRLGEIRQMILKRAEATKDVTRANTLEDQAFGIWLQQRGLRDQLAQDAAQKAQDAAQKIKDAAEKAAQARDAATQKMQDAFGLKLDRAGLTKTLADDLATLREWEASVQQRMTVVGHTAELESSLVDLQGRIAATLQQQRDNAQAQVDAAEAQVDAAFDLQALRAQLTKTSKDDLAVLRARERHVLDQMQTMGKTLELQTKLVNIQLEIKSIEEADAQAAKEAAKAAKEKAKAAKEAAKEAAKAARERAKAKAERAKEAAQRAAERARAKTAAAQFGALGFGPTGGEIIPGVGALRERLESIQGRLAGARLLTPKIADQINAIGKVLSGAFGKVGSDVRAKIDEIMDSWRDALDEGAKKLDLTKFHRPTAFGAVGAHPAGVEAIAAAVMGVDPRSFTRGGRPMINRRLVQPRGGIGRAPGLRAVPGGYVPAPITINGNVNLHGVQSTSELEQQLTKRHVGRAHLRRGSR